MNKKQLVDILHRRCRTGHAVGVGHYRPAMTKADVEAVLHHLGAVILEEVLLKGDRVALPNLGTARTERIGEGKKHLFAMFDWAKSVEQRISEENKL